MLLVLGTSNEYHNICFGREIRKYPYFFVLELGHMILTLLQPICAVHVLYSQGFKGPSGRVMTDQTVQK